MKNKSYFLEKYKEILQERFFEYVKIDTQSDPNSNTFPSTEKQKDLGRFLVEELHSSGIENAFLDDYGYVYASISSNSTKTNVPTVVFCSHLDTSPDCSGSNVRPIHHQNYQGQDIILPDDVHQIIKLNEHPDLINQIGNDLITASGLTLLGADNKAGVAEIMTAVNVLVDHPEIKHGEIKIVFTPDEEIGKGTENINLEFLNAQYAYTVDGESLGTIENETFSANGLKITINGVGAHPGFGKGKLINALKIGAEIIENLPKNGLSPETTEGREGFVHPTDFFGNQESATISFILRDFTLEGLKEKEVLIEKIAKRISEKYNGCNYKIEVAEQYRNMKEILDKYPQTILNAIEAVKRAGITPKLQSIRGGTDGSRLSFMGLPCPNIFAGEHAFHSKLEWVSLQDMMKATEVILNLCEIWEEKA
jgi:tripeptide aminopeptidase